jgi:hypothetical protein
MWRRGSFSPRSTRASTKSICSRRRRNAQGSRRRWIRPIPTWLAMKHCAHKRPSPSRPSPTRSSRSSRTRPRSRPTGQHRSVQARSGVLPHRRARRRPGRPAPGRSRQLRHGLEFARHRRHHHDEADDGAIHRARRTISRKVISASIPARSCRSRPIRATTPTRSRPVRCMRSAIR